MPEHDPMRTPYWLLALIAVSASACATHAPVEKVSRDTFKVRTHVVGSLSGASDAQARNAERATEYCAGRGQKMTILEEQTVGGLLPQDTATFRCGTGGPRGPKAEQAAKGA
jgi:hypothetical protein